MPVTTRYATTRIAFAVALAASTGLIAAPAMAAKKEPAQAQGKANYTKEFVALYQPLAKQLEAGGDLSAMKAQVATITAAAKTPDDKVAAGQLVYNLGVKTSDPALQLQGADLMTASGKLDPAQQGKTLFASAQIAYQAKDWAGTQMRAQKALDAGYTDGSEILLAESYFAQKQPQQGIAVLDKAMARLAAANQPVPEAWLKRAIAVSYGANLTDVASKYAGMYALRYPSKDSWGDALAILRNGHDYDGAELLDVMRLADRTGSMRNKRDYIDYISAADARRLPSETLKVLNQGVSAGMLNSNEALVAEAKGMATPRVATVQADLPALDKAARAGAATPTMVFAAADTYLSLGQSAKAAELYTMALTKPGVDMGRALTRLGIAQIDEGKYAEAQATFAKVQGERAPIAQLWSIYAQQKAGGTAVATK